MRSRPQLEDCNRPRNGKRLKTSGQAALQRGRLSHWWRFHSAKGNKLWLAEDGQGEPCKSTFLRQAGIWTWPIFSRLPKQHFLSLPLISAAYCPTRKCCSNAAPSPASSPPLFTVASLHLFFLPLLFFSFSFSSFLLLGFYLWLLKMELGCKIHCIDYPFFKRVLLTLCGERIQEEYI